MLQCYVASKRVKLKSEAVLETKETTVLIRLFKDLFSLKVFQIKLICNFVIENTRKYVTAAQLLSCACVI